MKFSVFTVSTPEYDIKETVKVLSELGYDGIEWRISAPAPEKKPDDYTYERRYWSYNRSTLDIKKVSDTVEKVKEICDMSHLEICSLTTYLHPWDVEDIEKVLESAKSIGCKNIRVMPPLYNEEENYRCLFDRTVEQVKKLQKITAKYQVRINFEIHMGNIIPSASAAYRFASNFNPQNIGIIYDPGNMVHEGFENYRLGIELLGEYLAHVHVKNAVWSLNETSEDGVEFWKPVWAPLKSGYANITKLVNILKEINYDGYVSVEDFSNNQDTYTKLKDNLKFLRKISG